MFVMELVLGERRLYKELLFLYLKIYWILANEAIQNDEMAATLRFGHDGNVMPLTGLLHLEGCYGEETNSENFYRVWSDYKIVPMAANVQIIF